MEITLIEKTIKDVPILELVQKDRSSEALPTVFFYHGWKSRGEGVSSHALELARKGFRVVCPDAFQHGARYNVNIQRHRDTTIYYQVIQHNLMEFPILVETYKSEQLTNDTIGVAGVSLGAVTASMLFCRYDWIHSAVLLEGSPAPRTFTKEIYKKLREYYQKTNDTVAESELKDSYAEVHEQLAIYDLMENPQNVAHRPLLIWHGKDDPVADVKYDQEFFEKIQSYDEGERVHAIFSEKSDHRVPYHISYMTAAFFEQVIKDQDIPIAWQIVHEDMAEKFGKHPEKRFCYHLDSFE